jgi:hypothetical protein
MILSVLIFESVSGGGGNYKQEFGIRSAFLLLKRRAQLSFGLFRLFGKKKIKAASLVTEAALVLSRPIEILALRRCFSQSQGCITCRCQSHENKLWQQGFNRLLETDG